MSARHESYCYKIVVQGHLDDRWGIWFQDLLIIRHASGETELSGEIADQAALYGILNRLSDIGLELISVQRSSQNTEKENNDE